MPKCFKSNEDKEGIEFRHNDCNLRGYKGIFLYLEF